MDIFFWSSIVYRNIQVCKCVSSRLRGERGVGGASSGLPAEATQRQVDSHHKRNRNAAPTVRKGHQRRVLS